MYGCESWTIKKAEHWGIDTFELEKTLASPLDCKEIQPVNPKGNQLWILIGRSDAETEALIGWPPIRWEELTHWKRPWCWERLKVGGEEDNTGWEDFMASPTRWTWVWASSRSWWWTGKLGVLQSMQSQRVWHNWATEMNWTGCLVDEESTFKAGDCLQSSRPWLNHWVGKVPWRRSGNILQYSCLGNPTGREAGWVTVHGVVRIRHNLATYPPAPMLI